MTVVTANLVWNGDRPALPAERLLKDATGLQLGGRMRLGQWRRAAGLDLKPQLTPQREADDSDPAGCPPPFTSTVRNLRESEPGSSLAWSGIETVVALRSSASG
ncbi:hypothetical protein NLG97_g1731 [Lecanicillium saksenae]|uniref:Uncharacterized protein n=1 Tax=Lecanicillium saksenae TaxID=468837 RepID=A0ACC1R2Y2_9HYPO|nr:hypothetical protein NLG97_g1731 [Lecanicillium saksenae]